MVVAAEPDMAVAGRAAQVALFHLTLTLRVLALQPRSTSASEQPGLQEGPAATEQLAEILGSMEQVLRHPALARKAAQQV